MFPSCLWPHQLLLYFSASCSFTSFTSSSVQLQKAIEGSTRSGVRLRPPLASFRDISNHTPVSSPPPSSPSSTTAPPLPSSSPAAAQRHRRQLCRQDETEVWIEGEKAEEGEAEDEEVEEEEGGGADGGSSSSGVSGACCTSSSRSCSCNSNLTLPPSSTPPVAPPPRSPSPPSSSIRLSVLQRLFEDSDDEPMV